MLTIKIEIKCENKEQAEMLTDRVMNGDHRITQEHGVWVWVCSATPDEIRALGQELHYELE